MEYYFKPALYYVYASSSSQYIGGILAGLESNIPRILFKPPSYSLYREAIDLFKQVFTVKEIGLSAGGEPIYSIELGEGNYTVAVVAGLHPNEPAPITACLLLLSIASGIYRVEPYFTLEEYLRDIKLAVVPLANPDGYKVYSRCIEENPVPLWSNPCSRARVNSRGIDLNRDWMYLTQPETVSLHRYISKLNPVFILDLHEFYAEKGCPPRWASEVLGFMVTLTDAPYYWVSEEVKKISWEAGDYVSRAIRSYYGGSWPIRYRHFLGGSSGEEKIVPSPSILGAHVALENIPKLLVETWGVGLHSYLFHDRIHIHLYSILSVLDYIHRDPDRIAKAIDKAVEEDRAVYGSMYRRIVIRGKDLRKAGEVLKIHGINYRVSGETLVIEPWEQVGRNKIALILLDRECQYNEELKRKMKGPYTLDRFLNIEIELS